MIKNVIAPVQAWLLSQGRCVGCGTDLKTGKQDKQKDNTKVTCLKCSRIFIQESNSGKYRRALLTEV